MENALWMLRILCVVVVVSNVYFSFFKRFLSPFVIFG